MTKIVLLMGVKNQNSLETAVVRVLFKGCVLHY